MNWREMAEANRAEYGVKIGSRVDLGLAVTKVVTAKRKALPGYGTVHGISNKVLNLAPREFMVYSKAGKAGKK